MQAVAKAKTDGTRRRSKISDVWSFNRCRDNEQRSRPVLASIVAKTPMCVRRYGLVGAFVGVQSKGTKHIALGAANNVAQIKLNAIKSIWHDAERLGLLVASPC